MFELIRQHQMNIMLALCAVCAMMAVLLLLTRFLPEKRKRILILMEIIATLLLAFDRAAYLYRGDVTRTAYVLVRLSNFMVFFLTSAVVWGFNLYLTDLLMEEGGLKTPPKRLKAAQTGALLGMLLAVIAHFTGLYYTFDEQNQYQRGPGFLLCYLVPVFIPLIQYTVIREHKKKFRRLIYLSLVLYIFLPIAVGILQIFTYGISIVNMAMVLVSVSLYIFSYLDINDEVIRAHETEVRNLEKEQQSMKKLFEQTATAFVRAIEKKDDYSEGHSARVAEYAREIAEESGKSREDSEKVYYAGLLHDVGMIGIPDAVLEKTDVLNDAEYAKVRQKPVLSGDILSSITEYPYLSRSVRYSCERYDGTGYPEGLSGVEIPEIARIIAVADAYDTMTSKKRFREPLSYQAVREEFVEQSGLQFDPAFSEIMIQIMDREHEKGENAEDMPVETEYICESYRERVSAGIPIEETVTKICFTSEVLDPDGAFSGPSVILFDSYDRHIHDNAKAIKACRYIEFAEIWPDGHYVSTNARNMEVSVSDEGEGESGGKQAVKYELLAGRFEDHLTLTMRSPSFIVRTVLALPDNSKVSYLGITGENCRIRDIRVFETGERLKAGDIKRIVSPVSYTDRLESDLPNIQVDRPRLVSTEAVEVLGERRLDFHTQSLPSSNLIWHCPYVVLFDSPDGSVCEEGYREYALIKLNGECTGDESVSQNHFTMKKLDSFPGWDVWKEQQRKGMECSVLLERKGNKVTLRTETLGIAIENTTILSDGKDRVFAALTGDQVALTDIRVR